MSERFDRPYRGGGRRDSFPHVHEEDPPGTSRLFIAVPVAREVRDGVGALMEQVADGPVDRRMPGQPRWVAVENLHITLRFLGSTPDTRQAEVAEVIAAVAATARPFKVALCGGGAFPNQYRPRVLWIGIDEGTQQLAALERRVDAELRARGWQADDRPFAAHLTLARTDGVPGAADRARKLIEVARDVDLEWQVDSLVLYKSNLGHGPTHYEALATAPMTAGKA